MYSNSFCLLMLLIIETEQFPVNDQPAPWSMTPWLHSLTKTFNVHKWNWRLSFSSLWLYWLWGAGFSGLHPPAGLDPERLPERQHFVCWRKKGELVPSCAGGLRSAAGWRWHWDWGEGTSIDLLHHPFPKLEIKVCVYRSWAPSLPLKVIIYLPDFVSWKWTLTIKAYLQEGLCIIEHGTTGCLELPIPCHCSSLIIHFLTAGSESVWRSEAENQSGSGCIQEVRSLLVGWSTVGSWCSCGTTYFWSSYWTKRAPER